MRQDDTAARAELILDAAEPLFLRFGYRRTSMDDVAKASDVAKGTLYLYFANKETLYAALHARIVKQIEDLSDQAERNGGRFADRLFALLCAWYGTLFERFRGSDHIDELRKAGVQSGIDALERAALAYRERVMRMVAEADTRGEVRLSHIPLDVASIVDVLLIAAHGAKLADPPPRSSDEYRQELSKITAFFSASLNRP